MRITLATLSVLFLSLSFGQTYIVKGKLTFPNLPDSGRVYYEFNEEPTKEKFVEFNAEHQFEIVITQEDILNDSIAKLYFTSDLDSKWPCFYKINIDNIQSSKLFTKEQKIELHAHHDHFLDCDLTTMESAEDDGNGKYVGKYKFVKDGIEYELELMDHYYGKIIFPQLDKQYMNVGHSSWSYSAASESLTISSNGRANNDFGLYIKEDWTVEFKVQNKSGKLLFNSNSEKYVLVKN